MRVLFTGGGTGGHFYPLIAVAKELKKIAEEERILDLELFYMGPLTFGGEELKKEQITYYPVSAGKIRRYFSLFNISDMIRTAIGVIQAAWHLFIIMPDMIFSKGGYGAFPVLLVARLYRIPVIIHESDVNPGMVNLWSAKFAARMAVSFAGTSKYFPPEKTALVGNPTRITTLKGDKKEAEEELSIYSEDPVIFFIGGSQGAVRLNETITQILPELVDKFEILHQTGKANFEAVRLEAATILERLKKEKYHAYGFLNEGLLKSAFTAADLIISRAGSSAIFEIAAAGKASIIIPIKNSANNHQRENAYAYAASGACAVIEEDNLSPHVLSHEIEKIFAQPEAKKKMEEAAAKFARPEAAEKIAREILKLGLH